MRMIRDVLTILASLALIVYVCDGMATKYKTDENMISCSYDPVKELFINVTTKELKKSIEKQGFVLDAKVITENITTEERKMTIGNKAKYACNGTVEISIKANPNNDNNVQFIKKIANKGSDTFSTSFDRDYTVTENDLGTTFWIKANKISEYEISNLLKN